MSTELGSGSSPANAAAILLVEDDDLVLPLLKSALEHRGFLIEAHTTGEEALRWLEDQPAATVSACVADLNLPDMRGGDLLRRACEIRPGITCVLTTGASDADAHDAIRGLPDAQVLMKPFQAEMLARLLRPGKGERSAET